MGPSKARQYGGGVEKEEERAVMDQAHVVKEMRSTGHV